MKDPRRFAFAPDGTAIRRCVRCREPITAHAPECAGVFTPSQPPTIARAGDLARVRDRACEACGFLVCTPACEAETARALAEIEANKAAEAERLAARLRAEADTRAAAEAMRDAEGPGACEELARTLAEPVRPYPAGASPDLPGERPRAGRDHVVAFRCERVAPGAEVRIIVRTMLAFQPRRLCVTAGEGFEIQSVRMGQFEAIQHPISAVIYSPRMQRYAPTLGTLPAAQPGHDLAIVARNIGAESEAFAAAIWGPLPEERPRADREADSHAGRMAAAGCEHPAYVGCRFCAPE